jgi:hypothetical protein
MDLLGRILGHRSPIESDLEKTIEAVRQHCTHRNDVSKSLGLRCGACDREGDLIRLRYGPPRSQFPRPLAGASTREMDIEATLRKNCAHPRGLVAVALNKCERCDAMVAAATGRPQKRYSGGF